MPAIHNCLEVMVPCEGIRTMFEVVAHSGPGEVRCINLAESEGLFRGKEVADVGTPLMVPVGRETLGRVLNVLGDPIDNRGPLNEKKKIFSS